MLAGRGKNQKSNDRFGWAGLRNEGSSMVDVPSFDHTPDGSGVSQFSLRNVAQTELLEKSRGNEISGVKR